jgi:hypothetical protein
MNAIKSISRKCFAVGAAIGLSSTFLIACSQSDADTKKKVEKVVVQQPGPSAAEKRLAAKNQPRSIELPALELADPSQYQDMRNPMTALRVYTALHDWAETQEDVVDSVKNPILVRNENPDLYKYGYDILTTQDAFKKKDLSDKIYSIVKDEANKGGSNRLVKGVILDRLNSYDFTSKGFTVSSCMFSDKLDYTDEELRNQASFSRAGPTRCYLNPGPADYLIGFTGGSKVFFDVPDEAVARKIEAARPTSNIVVYGYVKNIEREIITDRFGPKRYVLIAPQRVDVVDTASGAVLLSKTL